MIKKKTEDMRAEFERKQKNRKESQRERKLIEQTTLLTEMKAQMEDLNKKINAFNEDNEDEANLEEKMKELEATKKKTKAAEEEFERKTRIDKALNLKGKFEKLEQEKKTLDIEYKNLEEQLEDANKKTVQKEDLEKAKEDLAKEQKTLTEFKDELDRKAKIEKTLNIKGKMVQNEKEMVRLEGEVKKLEAEIQDIKENSVTKADVEQYKVQSEKLHAEIEKKLKLERTLNLKGKTLRQEAIIADQKIKLTGLDALTKVQEKFDISEVERMVEIKNAAVKEAEAVEEEFEYHERKVETRNLSGKIAEYEEKINEQQMQLFEVKEKLRSRGIATDNVVVGLSSIDVSASSTSKSQIPVLGASPSLTLDQLEENAKQAESQVKALQEQLDQVTTNWVQSLSMADNLEQQMVRKDRLYQARLENHLDLPGLIEKRVAQISQVITEKQDMNKKIEDLGELKRTQDIEVVMNAKVHEKNVVQHAEELKLVEERMVRLQAEYNRREQFENDFRQDKPSEKDIIYGKNEFLKLQLAMLCKLESNLSSILVDIKAVREKELDYSLLVDAPIEDDN